MPTLEKHRVTLSAESQDQAELAVHALAQLPNSVQLELIANVEARRPVELLAAAYGVLDRISLVSANERSSRSTAIDSTTFSPLVEAFWQADEDLAPRSEADNLLRGQRIAVVTNLPTHYRVPLFNELNDRLAKAEAIFRVFFLARPPATRSWMIPGEINFEHEFLRGIDLSRDRGRRILPLDMLRRVEQFRPTSILTAGFSPAVSGRISRYAERNGIIFGLWSGELSTRPTARQYGRAIQRRRLVRAATFAIAYGLRSAAYLRTLRDDLPLVIGRNTALIPEVRSRTPAPESVEVLAVARLEREKALDVIVDAMRRTPRLPCRLTVIGDGPERSALVARAAGDSRIRFLGALPPAEVRRALAIADVFVFPSRYDVFGLVLVEAMGAGLAPLVSPLPGAVEDLCVSGHNCIVVDEQTPAAWADCLARVVEDRGFRQALGAAAARTVRCRWTVKHAADAMLAGLRLGVLARGGEAGRATQ
jgi:glycosyltransferase involved in cell wall biosynthesis